MNVGGTLQCCGTNDRVRLLPTTFRVFAPTPAPHSSEPLDTPPPQKKPIKPNNCSGLWFGAVCHREKGVRQRAKRQHLSFREKSLRPKPEKEEGKGGNTNGRKGVGVNLQKRSNQLPITISILAELECRPGSCPLRKLAVSLFFYSADLSDKR